MQHGSAPVHLNAHTSLPGPAFAVLWAPIPIITWLFPAIGHMGVSKSDGTCVDFAGPYYVSESSRGRTIFGPPARYLMLEPRRAAASKSTGDEPQLPAPAPELDPMPAWWDGQVDRTAGAFRAQPYNLLGNNCHAFVAAFLNQIGYSSYRKWDMVKLAALVFVRGRYTSASGFLLTWLPFAVIVGLGAYFGRLIFLYVWLGLVAPLIIWFLLYVYVLSS